MKTASDRDKAPETPTSRPVDRPGSSRRTMPGRDHARDAPHDEGAPPTSLTRPPRATSQNPLPPGQRDPDNLDQDAEDDRIERDPP